MLTMMSVALDPYLRDWIDLLLRWLHVIAAIGWIGSSFYFVLLDQSLRVPKDPNDVADGVRGELWEVHGGGFYHVKKYQVAPPELPDHLEWFKWEAYTTWISGFVLMIGLYWFDAKSRLIDPSVADLTAWEAVGLSAGLLLVAWIYYDIACRVLGRRPRLLALVIVAGIAFSAWGVSELYAPRAAWLQVGAMIGTIMAANVFFNIIPAHWELIRAKEAGRDPDPTPGIEAKRRSVHNNYFTLPVLITMLAGHFAFLTGHEWGWVAMLVLMALGAWIRHFYNLRHGGDTRWWMLAVFAAVIIAMFVWFKPDTEEPVKKAAATASTTKIDGAAVFATAACASCHTLGAADAAGTSAPNLDSARPDAALVVARVTNGQGAMPAYRGKLSDEEIEALAEYVSDAAGRE